MTMRWTLLALLCCAACGGSPPTVPTTPSPTPVTPAPAPPAPTWSLAGRVLNTLTRQPIGGAHVSGFDVTTGSDGTFTATGPGTRTNARVTIDAGGFVSRETTIDATNTAPTLDLFPSSLLDLYRQLVRNGLEQPNGLQPIRRWTSAPQFYISQDGQLSGEDVRRITVGIQAAVSQLTPFSSPAISVGPSRADQTGWITVAYIVLSVSNCGLTVVGGNPGHINLNATTNCTTVCRGGKAIPGLVAHEVGHALGFWHTSAGLMLASVNPAIDYCTDAVQFTAAERQAATIAYSRPSGNTDPDTDPPAF